MMHFRPLRLAPLPRRNLRCLAWRRPPASAAGAPVSVQVGGGLGCSLSVISGRGIRSSGERRPPKQILHLFASCSGAFLAGAAPLRQKACCCQLLLVAPPVLAPFE